MAAHNGAIVLFGGYGLTPSDGGFPTELGDTWIWDGGAWTQFSAPGPSPRDSMIMVAY
jgi:hypothetical protein